MNVPITGRYAVMLTAVALVAAGPQAVAAPATAPFAACHSGHPAGRAGGSGGAATGQWCGAGPAGLPDRAAGPLALLQRRGADPWAMPGGRHVAAALPAGTANIPEPGDASILNGVTCVAPGNCWAVGYYLLSASEEVPFNEVLHWNGTAWSQVTVPNPGGTAVGDASELFSVRCPGPSNCWAVGGYTANGAFLNQILHWNGTRWSLAASPDPGGIASGDVNELFDVVCRLATNCWAVGLAGSTVSQTVNQALHWNGTRWSPVATPDPGGTSANDVNGLFSIRCPASGTCLAVGSYGTFTGPAISLNQSLLWNGTTWTQVTTPNPGPTTTDGDTNTLLGLACTSSSNCWAAGTYGPFQGTFNQALHWDGATWSLVATPDPGGNGEALNQLNAVTCTAATNCWAVGIAGAAAGNVADLLNQALHWDGGTWSVVATPDPAGTTNAENELEAVRCTSASNCWSVGVAISFGPNSSSGEALHWDGSIWSTG
jgi:hypothetical protein